MNEELSLLSRHFRDMARRSSAVRVPLFSDFLSPAEQDTAEQIVREEKLPCLLYGGYPDAERKIVCFGDCSPEDFPIRAIEVMWPHQSAPTHRDLLGSVLGLGLKRGMTGDIVLDETRAILFVHSGMADMISRQWCAAGRVHLQIRLLQELPTPKAAEGEEIRCTVMSMRLDAVLSGACRLSRSEAAALVGAGRVKKNHLYCLKPDERLEEGDVLSIAGYGRVILSEVGSPTRKARLPLMLTRYGFRNHHNS